MKEERIRHLTHDEFPTILLPCYITATGEVWQYSKRHKKVVQRKPMYDRTHDKAVVNLANDRTIAKYDVRPLPLATAVYRYFSGDANIGQQLHLDYRDGDPMNCNVENLFIRAERYNKKPRFKRVKIGDTIKKIRVRSDEDIVNELGLQIMDKRLVLSDYDSVMLFFELQREHRESVLADTQLVIDTTDWTAEQLRKLLKMKARLTDTIIK